MLAAQPGGLEPHLNKVRPQMANIEGSIWRSFGPLPAVTLHGLSSKRQGLIDTQGLRAICPFPLPISVVILLLEPRLRVVWECSEWVITDQR